MEQLVFYRTIRVDGLSIFYREAGPRDAPTLLLLHGSSIVAANVSAKPLTRLADVLTRLRPTIQDLGTATGRTRNSLITPLTKSLL